MKLTRLVGLLALAIGGSGCATSAYRDRFDVPGERSTTNPRTTRTADPRQVYESVPARADDPAAQSAAAAPGRFDRFRLSHYLNPTGRTNSGAAAPAGRSASAGVVEVAARVEAAPAAGPGRASWFGLRRPKEATTYLTDAKGGAGRSAVVPTRLPGLVPDLGDRIADRAVTTTSAEGPAPADGPVVDPPAPSSAPTEAGAGVVSARPIGDLNPDSSGATAEPFRADEPKLAVAPIAPPRPATPAWPEVTPEPAAEAARVASAAGTSAAAPADSTDPEGLYPERLRGRPRLANSSTPVEGARGDRAAAGSRSPRAAVPGPGRRSPLFARRPGPAATPAPADPGVRATADPGVRATAVMEADDSKPVPDVVAGGESTRPATATATATSEPTAAPTPEPTAAEAPRAGLGDPAAVRAVPTSADPGRSLGLPELVLPASYSKHGAGAVRGSGQFAPSGPVLASPQVEASPQAAASPQSPAGVVATATKAKSKFCRFLRKCLCLDKKAKAAQ